MWLLNDQTNALAERRAAQLVHVQATDPHTAAARIPRPYQQACDRRFAATRAPDDAQRSTWLDREAHLLQDQLIRAIGEVDMRQLGRERPLG